MPSTFVHLHAHSDYSLLSGCMKTNTLIQSAKDMGMRSVALTDNANLYGAIHFYKQARAANIKPIIGMEAYVAPQGRLDRKDRKSYPIVLLAESNTGFANLIKLSSLGFMEGFYYRPRVDTEILAQHSEGLICLSGGGRSQLAHYVLLEDKPRAAQLVQEYQEIFGKENFFFEIENHGLIEQAKVCQAAGELSKELNVPLVAANDVRYAVKDHALAFEFMRCLSSGRTLDDSKHQRMESEEFYLKTAEEMRSLFPDYPQAIENTVDIASRIHLNIDFSESHLPLFNSDPEFNAETYFRDLCESGLRDRYGEITEPIRERFEHEFKVIKEMHYIDYFLIVWEFINHAREENIPVGPGRGSAAGSIIAYATGITQIEPLSNGLLFERFLNSSRISMPDIDIDFCQAGRSRVIEYVQNKYGGNRVSQIITFGSMKARGAIRDVGRVLNVPLSKVDKTAKLIPEELGITLSEALKKSPELKDLHKNDDEVRSIFEIALVIEGMFRHTSEHAAGIVISDKDLWEYLPVCVKDDHLVTQYDMVAVEQIGMLKMDFLGLDALTIIATALTNIESNHGVTIDFETLEMDDPETYKLIATGDLKGVFQLESSGMSDLCMRMRPDDFGDITALIALYRPGPLGSGMVDTFLECKHGKQKASYAHPILEPILKETHGVILYQEQVMRIAGDMALFTMNDADNLRKAMGKKKPEIMAEFRDKFVTGSQNNKVSGTIAKDVFQQMEYFAGYGFNKSHSAAYAAVTYRTAFLKANYAEEFMAALMSCKLDSTDRIVAFINDCRRMDIEVFPPNVNQSDADFTPSKGGIHFGLAAIKGLGVKAVNAIVQARNELPDGFESIYHFCEHVDLRAVNKQCVDALIKSGAMDCYGARRSQLYWAMESAMESGSSAQADKRSGQMNFFGSFNETEEDEAAQGLPDIPEWPENELLKHEKNTLGFFISSHPLAEHASLLSRFSSTSCARLAEMKDGQELILGGYIAKLQMRNTKKGDLMARMKFEDLSGEVETLLFPKSLVKNRDNVEEEAIVFLKGRVDLSRETPQIIINEVIPLHAAVQQLTNKVWIKMTAAGIASDSMQRLQTILKENRGHCEVLLTIHRSDKSKVTMKLPQEYAVTPSPTLIQEVTALLGDNHIICDK